jgi:RNA polymerase sigma-70 factor (ECF subfamily)
MTTAIAHPGTAARSHAMTAAGQHASDNALMARIAAGDQNAMRVLFSRHQTTVYRWLRRLVEDSVLAEDLLNEVFLEVWCHAADFAGRSAVSTWLLAIARHKALSARRRRCDDQLDDELAESIRDDAGDAQAMLEDQDRRELLTQGLRRLSREHRSVVDLVYYHGKSVKEVAAILGVPPATVKTRMFYARSKLAAAVRAAAA